MSDFLRHEIKIYPQAERHSGPARFPNEPGLFAWKIIAFLVTLLVLTTLVRKRKEWWLKLTAIVRQVKKPENLILIATFLLAFWMLSNLWGAGLPASWDACQHYVRCLVTKNVLLSNFKIEGWSPYWYLGSQQFLFYSPFLFVLICLVNLLSFEILPLMFCYKLFYFIIFLGVPLAGYWLMRKINIPAVPSALAALGAISFSAIHGFGVAGLFVAGLMTQGFGLILFTFSIGFLMKLGSTEAKFRDVLILGLLTGLIFITHVISAFYFMFCLVIFSITNLLNRKFFFRLAIAMLIALAISSFQIWPTYNFIELKLPGVGWTDFNFWGAIISGSYFSSRLVNWLALLGFIIALFSKHRAKITLALLAIATYLSASSTVVIDHPIYYEAFKQRLYPYLAIYFIVFTGLFYEQALNLIEAVIERIRKIKVALKPIVYKFVVLTLVVIVGITILHKCYLLRDRVKLYSDYEGPREKKFYQAFSWAKDNLPENIVMAMDMRMEDGLHLLNSNFINIFGNRYNLHGESGIRPGIEHFDRHFSIWDPERLYQFLVRYNISYVMSWTSDVPQNLLKRSDLFHPVFYDDPIIIWQVMQHAFLYLDSKAVRVSKFYFSPEVIKWSLKNEKKNNLIATAVSYHPNWHLYVNGASLPLKRTHDGIMEFILPDIGDYNLELRFERTITERILYVVSAGSLLLVLFALFKIKR